MLAEMLAVTVRIIDPPAPAGGTPLERVLAASNLLRPDDAVGQWLRDPARAATTGGPPFLLGRPCLVARRIRLLLTGRPPNPARTVERCARSPS